MKVLYIHQYFRTRSEAGGTRSYEFARRWVQNGHQVTMITAADGPTGADGRGHVYRQNIDGIDVLAVRVNYSNYMSFPRRVIAFLEFLVWATWIGLRQVPEMDIVFATSTPLTVGIPGYLISRWRKVPFVFEVRDLWPEAPIQLGALRNPVVIAAARWLERFLYRAAAHVVTLSPGMYEGVRQTGVEEDKLSMIPNCSDLDVFQPRSPSPEITARYNPERRFVLTYAGSLGLANGLVTIVETARILQERGQEGFLFYLIGEGREHPRLAQMAAQYGLRNLTLLPPMSKLELAEFMPLSDICLTIFAPFPVLETNSPNKLFDALALGRPVLINYGGWIQDVLEEHHAGVAVPSNDPGEIATRLIELRDRPDLMADMGRNARTLAETHYGRDTLAQQLEKVLQAVATGRGAAPRANGYGWIKRLMDIVISVPALIVCLPLGLLIALAIRLSSRGPVLFRQQRPGRHEKPFRMFKFCTMSEAHDPSGNLLPDTQRVTRLGRLLRSTSLDELPELWNVLKGEMSLVGPRPLLMRYLPYYKAPERIRFSVRPGITGWAQINGRNNLPWDDRLALDGWYVEHMSLGLDLRIMLATLLKVVKRADVQVVTDASPLRDLDEERRTHAI